MSNYPDDLGLTKKQKKRLESGHPVYHRHTWIVPPELLTLYGRRASSELQVTYGNNQGSTWCEARDGQDLVKRDVHLFVTWKH